MLRNIIFMIGAAATLGTLGYSAMAFRMVMHADTATVLSIAASETLPLAPVLIADWRVKSWDGCPVTERNLSPLGMTLRGYGLDGFDNDRVLATATRLIDLGCDVNQRNLTGHTAMHEAILYNEPDVVRFLLANGADPAVTIEVPNEEPTVSRRYFSGMNSIQFTEELQHKSSLAEDRSEILQLLQSGRG